MTAKATSDPEPEAAAVSWHALSVEETILKLRRNADLTTVGISTAEAAQLRDEYGPNKMAEKEKETIWQKIWAQIANVLVCILLIVAAVSAAKAIVEEFRPIPDSTTILTSWIQVGLITLVITVNTAIGILQEGSAEKAAEALKNMLSADARVIRDGIEKMIPSVEVVPGEVVILGLGDRIPADIRIFSTSNLACSEAALTGESVPIDKTTDAIEIQKGVNAEQIPLGDRHNMCFSATLVSQGTGIGIVIATGDHTQIGTINKLVSSVEKKKTNVLEQIDKVSKLLAVLIVIASTFTFFIAKFRADQSYFDAVSTALVCCVAMIPEGLEAIVTLTYAWAVTNMAKINAIIRALPAVETLGSVTVICSDKTGTLTQNIMSLTCFVTTNARYKFDVNSLNRDVTNFVRDDSYQAKRAEHAADKSFSDVIQGGANSGNLRKGQLNSSNHYAIGSTDIEPTGSVTTKVSDPTPFPDGSSPTFEFIQAGLEGGVLCSKCVLGQNGTREGEIGNPTEISILRAAYFSGMDIENLKKVSPLVAEVPFSSEYKFMATVHESEGDDYVVHCKGAPDRMVQMCNTQAKNGVLTDLEPIDADYWLEEIAILSSHGLRVLALTRANISKRAVNKGDNLGPEFINGRPEGSWLTMVGLCAIMDPPRKECVQAIKEAKGAGVRVAMITGDHKDTAIAIGRELGIVDEQYSSAVTGPQLDEMSDEEMKQVVMENNVFARASPQNKLRIVKALQAQKQIASMTGDGVNDAPALKAADMGVAMGLEGTDVAREASEMVLADDNFATIVAAVKEGRVVWDNLRKVLLVNTPINNAQGMSVLFGLLFGLKESPISPIQVLYSNLICAITLGFVSAIEPAEEGLMEMAPRRIGKKLIGRFLLLRILLCTFTLTSLVVGSAFWLKSYNADPSTLYKWCYPQTTKIFDPNYCLAKDGFRPKNTPDGDVVFYLEDIRAIAFNTLDFGAIAVTLSARFSYLSSFHPRIFYGNKYAWYSVGIVAVLQVFTTYTPGINRHIFQMRGMDRTAWGIVALFTCIVFFVMETEKGIRRMLMKKGYDTNDTEYGAFDNKTMGDSRHGKKLLPKGASKLNLAALDK